MRKTSNENALKKSSNKQPKIAVMNSDANPQDVDNDKNQPIDKSRYLRAVGLIELLHRRLLDVVKDELERSGNNKINSVQALMIFNVGDLELTAGELRQRGYYLGSNVSYNLKKLVELGLINQDRSAVDRRAVRITLTDAGHQIFRFVDRIFEKHVATLQNIGGLSVDMVSTLNDSLVRIDRFWNDQIRYRL